MLGRERVDTELEFTAAVPARKQVIESLATQLNVKPELIVVKKISPSFGSRKASVVAYVYKNDADMKKIEERKVLSKVGYNQPKYEKKVAAPVEAK